MSEEKVIRPIGSLGRIQSLVSKYDSETDRMVAVRAGSGLPVEGRVLSEDFLIEVRKGNVPGHTCVHKFGRNDAIPNGSWAFVNLLGFTAWPLAASTTVRIKAGGNAADIAGGAGAVSIAIQGIDSNFEEVTVTLATNGAGASLVTTVSFWRVHRAWVTGVGTYGEANTGNIVIENGAGGTDLIQIGADEGQTQFTGWTVPIGKTAYLLTMHVNVDGNQSANIRMFTRDDIDIVVSPMKSKRLKLFFDGVIGTLRYDPDAPNTAIVEKSDIWVEAFGGAGVTQVSVDFELLLVDNNLE